MNSRDRQRLLCIWTTVLSVACSSAENPDQAQSESLADPSADGSELTGEPPPPVEAARVDVAEPEIRSSRGAISATALASPAPTPNGSALPDGATDGTVMTYHGGPVAWKMNIYEIWYGNWQNAASTKAYRNIRGFVQSLINNHWNVNWRSVVHAYSDSGSQFAGTQLAQGHSYSSGYTYGRDLRDRSSFHPFYHVLYDTVHGGHLPRDPYGFYVIVPSSDVAYTMQNGQQLCNDFCGMHFSTTVDGTRVRYAIVANNTRAGCLCATTRGPNDDPIGDPAIDTIAHEWAETATDPNLDAWFDSSDPTEEEMADPCGYRYIGVSRHGSGYADIHDRSTNQFWLIQSLWPRGNHKDCTMGPAQ